MELSVEVGVRIEVKEGVEVKDIRNQDSGGIHIKTHVRTRRNFCVGVE